MSKENIKGNFINATKWSAITEIASKIVSPITNMILARIISPEAFGIVSTATMITSFADMFTDAGFQKYLVQHQFKSDNEKNLNANIAFWTNLGISIFLLTVITIFREKIAIMVGNPGLGKVISIASIQLLFTSFSSIQMALYRRSFDFKTLFVVKVISVFIPFVITIPLAYLGLSYWALIIGNITTQLMNAIILTVKSKWKPTLFYSVNMLKEMISFSMWSLIEAISIWFTAWIDVFIISNSLNQYYLGLYKNSTTMVNGIMSLITVSIVPAFFATLSRLQDDESKFNKMYFDTQRIVAILVFPLGVGVYLYSTLATQILLGNSWIEASEIIGLWALTSSITIVLGNLCSEVYRAKGRPKLSFLAQLAHLIFLIPACIIASRNGFWTLVYTRSGIRMQGVLIHLIIIQLVMGISIKKIIKNISPPLISVILMSIFAKVLQSINNGLVWDILSIILCCILYFMVLYAFPSIRKEINKHLNKFKVKKSVITN